VPAHIQQRANFTGRGSNDDDRFRPQIDQQIIAGARDAADMPGAKPVPQKHALHIALEYRRVGVEGPRKRMARPVISDARS
jgi:hypothetical protein